MSAEATRPGVRPFIEDLTSLAYRIPESIANF